MDRNRWTRGLCVGLMVALAAGATQCGPVDEPEATEALAQAITQCAGASTVQGVDVSTHNGTITWGSVYGAGIRFAVMKATQGSGYTDPTFAHNWAGARAAGVLRSPYHFFDPTVDGVAQARHFLAVVGTLEADDLPPMLDMECPDGDPNCLYSGGSGAGVPGSTIRSRMMDWLTTVEHATGRAPIIYTFGSYFSGAGIATTGLEHYPLFIANISSGACIGVPEPWSHAVMRQYSWHGSIAGIPSEVDRDIFYGSLDELRALASGAAGPAFAAQYVMQSWPLAAAGPIRLRPGERSTQWIEMRNTGTHAWDANTRLGTTVARDRPSPFHGPDWLNDHRLAQVSGGVMPGGTFRFAFTLVAPMASGTYDEHWGLVQEGATWFGDEGGPADGVIEAQIVVAGDPAADDAGSADDGAAGGDDAGAAGGDAGAAIDAGAVSDAGAASDARDGARGDGGGAPGMSPGCACRVAGARERGEGARGVAGVVAAAIATIAAARRRRQRARGR